MNWPDYESEVYLFASYTVQYTYSRWWVQVAKKAAEPISQVQQKV